MKMLKLTAAIMASGALALGFATPAAAQKSAVEPGLYWDVQDIHVENGHTEQYLDWLKDRFQKQCNWSVAKGYWAGCKVVGNVNKRMNEPDLVLIRMFKEIPPPAEMQRRQDEYQATIKMDDHALDADAATRNSFRKIGSDSLWQELNFTR